MQKCTELAGLIPKTYKIVLQHYKKEVPMVSNYLKLLGNLCY